MSQTQETVPSQAAATAGAPSVGGARRWRSSSWSASLTFIVFVLVFVGYGLWLGEGFVSASQRLLDVHQNVPLLLVALALLVCLVSGQFDLSVGGMATLTTYMTVGLVVNQQWPFGVVLVACLLIGVVGGAINAFLVIKLRVNAFIATLGTGAAFAGLSTVYSGGTQLAPVTGGPDLPEWFSGAGSFGSYQTKVPLPVTWVVLLFLLGVASLATASNPLLASTGLALVIGLVACLGACLLLTSLLMGRSLTDGPHGTLKEEH